MKRRILSLIAALILCLGLLPGMVQAAEESIDEKIGRAHV